MMTQPTDSELQILRVLWEKGPSSVRGVNERLTAVTRMPIGYTTTLKLMQIMHEKELLGRDTSQRSHIYRPLVERDDVEGGLLRKLADSAYGGSATRLALRALGEAESTSAEELEELRRLIDRLEKDNSHE
ncbi:MAG: BlaI/MecI/CopY family transcriptional regulator [Saprospiraceae bacterium]